MKPLGERKHEILVLAVEEYIKDATPITSGGVQKNIVKELSTATLRNELNALEAMGFLRQLHTSGGRVPTAEGYRYYVTELLKNVNASERELDNVSAVISDRASSLSEIISNVADVISKATNYPTVVLMEGCDNLVLHDIKIIPLLSDKLLVLLGTAAGYLNINVSAKASQTTCDDASKYLTKYFKGRTIKYMIENFEEYEKGMQDEIISFKEIIDNLITGLKEAASKKVIDVRKTGTAKLISEESIDGAKHILEILDDEKILENAISADEDGGIIVTVAEEDDEMSGCAIIKAPIIVNGQKLASVGVVGPHRMDYATIAGTLKVLISELEHKGEDGS